jgi:DNA polymerase-3 subunit delta'
VTSATLPGTEHHPHARAVLGAALAKGGAPSHAYLFHGPGGTGKREVARAFAAELLSEGLADDTALQSVRTRVEHGSHPDLTWVRPSGAHELLVSDIDRPVVAAATRTPFEAKRRVFVIEAADTMNDESANRMLKTLEEPASYVHLILLTARPSELLPTIASRCQHVRFDALPTEELERRLLAHGVDETLARACGRLAHGDGELALDLAQGRGAIARADAEAFASAVLEATTGSRRPWEALLTRAKEASAGVEETLRAEFEEAKEVTAKKDQRRLETDHGERLRRGQRRAERAQLDLTLRLLGLWFRDLACVAYEAADLVAATDRMESLVAAADGRDPARLCKAVELVEDTRLRLELNVAEDLALEALAYRLEDLLA